MIAELLTLILAAILGYHFLFSKQTKVPEPKPKVKFSEMPIVEEKSTKPTKPKNKPITKVKYQDFKHENLLTTLKSHTDLISSISVSQNEKIVATSSDDRTVSVWQTKMFGKGNKHGKSTVDMDRATDVSLSPDGKGLLVSLNFNNCARLLKIDNESLKCTTSADLPNPTDDLDVHNIHFGYSCKQRNTVKESPYPWVLSHMVKYSKKNTRPRITVTDIHGKHLSGSPIDPSLGELNALKLSYCNKHFAACGFASQLKIYSVSDDKFLLKQVSSVSTNGQIFNFAFDAGASYWDCKKIAVVLGKEILVYELNENFEYGNSTNATELYRLNIEDLRAPNNKCFIEYHHPQIFLAINQKLHILNTENTEQQFYENMFPDRLPISGLKVMKTNKYLLVSGSKLVRVLKY